MQQRFLFIAFLIAMLGYMSQAFSEEIEIDEEYDWDEEDEESEQDLFS